MSRPRPIYLSGAISAGRADVGLYQRIAEGLERRGFRVQAGQVTNGAIVEGRGEALPDEEIWARDVRWLEEIAAADGAIVAEVTIPSLGVGYELALARWRFGIPVVAMHRPGPGRRCSAMIAGDPEIQLVPYGEEELEAALDRVAALLVL